MTGVQTCALPISSLTGDPEAYWPVPGFGPLERTAGAVVGLDLTPRLLLGQSFAIDGHYGFERSAAPTYVRSAVPCTTACTPLTTFLPATVARNAQRIGLGLRYSTVDAFQRGQSTTPIEVSLTHLQTISGSDGVARLQRDQIQVRLFLRVRSRR